jgi:putative endonuclease
MDDRRALGNTGEAIAAAHLVGLGYRIVAKQARTPFGELDLVAEDGEEVVFVEVKTRQDLTFGFPEESVTAQKLRHITSSAQHFLSARAWEARSYRIDVIAIVLPAHSPSQLTHLKAVDSDGALW